MNKRIQNIILIFVFILVAGCKRNGPLLADTPIEKIESELDAVTPSFMKRHDVVGLSLVVINDSKISISKSYGYADSASARNVDERTVFRAASLGKPVFAYIVISLAQQGKIDLDVPLYQYLKEEVVEGDHRSRLITARMVLDHKTGLPNLGENKSDITFLFDPDTDFQYSGHAYLYLQKVIEKRSGKSLNDLAKELVFEPLKMTDSSFIWQDKYRGRISSSYDNTGETFPNKENPNTGYSAWSLFTTINDYALFVLYMMETSSDQYSVADKMLKPYAHVAEGVDWGLGWGLQNTAPNRSFWHWGSMAGFRHYIVGYPRERTAVIVMSNSWRAFNMVDDVMAIAIGGSYPSYDWF
jgi:CubicO group peptidase (beta-lactamase class C family)